MKIREYIIIDIGKFVVNLVFQNGARLLASLFILGVKGVDGDIVILASCKYYFIIVHKNLVHHPSNNISIIV